ncbi:YlbF family regulator [Wukongibacter baidiensis]|uniref:YlbF family regulator n=1 Tax=Wukongibacter baidiensis TaxID=1723361 RepID=UPI003D7F8AA7
MKLIDMAEALAEEMSNSKEYTRYLSAQSKYMADENANALVSTFKRKQKVLEFTESNNDAADADRIKKEINDLFYEIEKNEVIQELSASLDAFLILKHSVHEKIDATTHIDDEILTLNKKCGGCKSKGNCGGCK